MSITLAFSRKVAGTVEQLSTLDISEGDYYDIYNHMVIDSGFATDSALVQRQAGFKVISITDGEITLEKISPPSCTETATSSKHIVWDFSQYGIYTISIA